MSEEKTNFDVTLHREDMPPAPSFEFKQRSREEEFYVNMVGIAYTVYDFRFDFGRRGMGDVASRADLTVYMSPQHAKDLALVILKVVKEYEEKVGPIPSRLAAALESKKDSR